MRTNFKIDLVLYFKFYINCSFFVNVIYKLNCFKFNSCYFFFSMKKNSLRVTDVDKRKLLSILTASPPEGYRLRTYLEIP